MPHVTIEYSANLANACSIQALVDEVHEAGRNHSLTPDAALRTRAQGRDHFRIADGDPSYCFVAVTARIGPGREPDAKEDFLVTLLDAVDGFVERNAPNLVMALSGEVQEIDPANRINRNHIRQHLASDQPTTTEGASA